MANVGICTNPMLDSFYKMYSAYRLKDHGQLLKDTTWAKSEDGLAWFEKTNSRVIIKVVGVFDTVSDLLLFDIFCAQSHSRLDLWAIQILATSTSRSSTSALASMTQICTLTLSTVSTLWHLMSTGDPSLPPSGLCHRLSEVNDKLRSWSNAGFQGCTSTSVAATRTSLTRRKST